MELLNKTGPALYTEILFMKVKRVGFLRQRCTKKAAMTSARISSLLTPYLVDRAVEIPKVGAHFFQSEAEREDALDRIRGQS
jgi:hypothetical protein